MQSKLYLSFVFMVFTVSIYSQQKEFGIGIGYQPFFYQSYNKLDWNNLPYSYPDDPTSFNGFAVGIVFDKPINNYFSLNSELTYSFQTQKHIVSSVSISDPDENILPYFYSTKVYSSFKFIKLPLMGKFNLQLGYESNYFLSIGMGIQLSYLLDYYSEDVSYVVDNITHVIDYNDFYQKDIRAKNRLEYYYTDSSKNPPQLVRVIGNPYEIYRTWQWGTLGEISIKKVFFSNYILSIGARYEYDFTDSEKNPSLIGNHRRPDGTGKKYKTHNIRKALNFSLMYLFE